MRLTPKSAGDEIGAMERLADGRMVLKVKVRALPQEGLANEALIRLFAKALRLPSSAIRLETGSTGRLKTLSLSGDPDLLELALTTLAGGKNVAP